MQGLGSYNLRKISNNLQTWAASFPRAQSASLQLSTLSPLRGAAAVAQDSIRVEAGGRCISRSQDSAWFSAAHFLQHFVEFFAIHLL